MKIDKLLSLMSSKKLNMAVVTDGYGGVLGIVTVEDILEELVGEIWDEDDVVEESFVPLGGGRFEVDAEMSLGETLERLGLDTRDLPDDCLLYTSLCSRRARAQARAPSPRGARRPQ